MIRTYAVMEESLDIARISLVKPLSSQAFLKVSVVPTVTTLMTAMTGHLAIFEILHLKFNKLF